MGDDYAGFFYDIYRSWWVILTCCLVAIVIAFGYLYFVKVMGGYLLWFSFIATIIILTVMGSSSYGYASLQYEDEDPTKKYIEIFAIILWCSIPVFILTMCYCFKNLVLGNAILKATNQYLNANYYAFFLPTVTTILTLIWIFLWLLSAVFLFSVGEPEPREDIPMLTHMKYDSTTRGLVIFSLLCLFWVNEIFYGSVQFIIGASTCIWYFNYGDDSKGRKNSSILTATYWFFRYHFASIALGSLIIGFCEMINFVFHYYRRLMGTAENTLCCVRVLLCMTSCCLYALEYCIKYISKNAYI
jgi:hypothetical protein